MLVHSVYFTLKDSARPRIDAMLADCETYLDNHPGVVFFDVGVLEKELDRPVNDLDFHIALHIAFQDRQSHDDYQKAERHTQFIEKNKENWERVRVFDSISQ